MADKTLGRGARAARPLSPHLQIYSPLINMMMSIVHRITGSALYFGSALLAWWLVSAAVGPEYFAYVSSWLNTWPGWIVLFGYTWALIHHALGGVRHFIWDSIHGFDVKTIDLLSWGSLAASVTLTLLVWAYGLHANGMF
ncbi:MAG: succinate dehydrogenase, cytochrome b556 subunit [Hyphomicrobiaceae bacterium]|nr:succinate dehydrogenase, cytochrome b556 subunit [Hyphomicrobiaceae bacterium]